MVSSMQTDRIQSLNGFYLESMFRSINHEVHTIEVNKVALNRDDDKRISKRDGISTLARGHWALSWSPLLGELLLI